MRVSTEVNFTFITHSFFAHVAHFHRFFFCCHKLWLTESCWKEWKHLGRINVSRNRFLIFPALIFLGRFPPHRWNVHFVMVRRVKLDDSKTRLIATKHGHVIIRNRRNPFPANRGIEARGHSEEKICECVDVQSFHPHLHPSRASSSLAFAGSHFRIHARRGPEAEQLHTPSLRLHVASSDQNSFEHTITRGFDCT